MLCLTDSIRDDDPCVQRLLCTVEEAHTLPELILAACWLVSSPDTWSKLCWPNALVADVVAPLPAMRGMLRSKGLVKRQVISLVGPLRWRAGSDGVLKDARPPGAPLDDALGLHPHQRTSGELQHLGCALAVLCHLPPRLRCWAGRAGWW